MEVFLWISEDIFHLRGYLLFNGESHNQKGLGTPTIELFQEEF